MRPLSDTIEGFIKALMEDQDRQIEVQRNELAQYFGCAPSQINYVLATRFSPDHGYMVESRRGGGGYIRIIRLTYDPDDYLHYLLKERIGNALSAAEAEAILQSLVDRELITPGEARLARAATCAQALSVPVNIKDMLRAQILRSMIQEIALRTKEEEA